jgi:hypothetical protein
MHSAHGQSNSCQSNSISGREQHRSPTRRHAPNLSRAIGGRFGAGQALVEFALVAGILVLIMIIGIQFALIGDAALAVNQLAYSAARYASVNYSTTSLSVSSAGIVPLIPPQLTPTGALSVSLSQPCAASPNNFGSTAIVTVTYDLQAGGKIFLSNPFLGVPITTTVAATQSAFCE